MDTATPPRLHPPHPARAALSLCLLLAAGLAQAAGWTLETAFGGARFREPVALIPWEDGYLLAERRGRVLEVAPDGRSRVHLDLRTVVESGPQEAGLLGLAREPAAPHRLYLSYTRPGRPLVSVVARREGDGRLSEMIRIPQPFANHNGGHIAFGPDGFLYIALGDGGAAGDPLGHAQNTRTLLGAILRIDPRGAAQGRPYAIPADNPFAGSPGCSRGCPELYAWGLRNPWRFAFDPGDGALWAGDVGQDRWEEVNLIVRGGNYGWNLREGRHCYRARHCPQAGLIDPLAEYGHDQGCAIIGGVVAGPALERLAGRFLFADYCSGRLWAVDRHGQVERLLDSDLAPTAFAHAPDGTVYLLDGRGGGIWRLAPGH